MFVNFTHPFGYLCERISISNVISDDDTVSTSIVAGSNSLKSILTGCVPNLEFDNLAINIDSLDFKVHSDCGHEIIMEVIVDESYQQ